MISLGLRKRIKEQLIDPLTRYIIVAIIVTLLSGWLLSLVSSIFVFRDGEMMLTIINNTPVFAAIEVFLAMLTRLSPS